MNYSNDPGSVRVDYFKPSGKWYTTESLNMHNFYDSEHYINPSEAVRAAMLASGNVRKQFIAVVLEPYFPNSYPVMITPESWNL